MKTAKMVSKSWYQKTSLSLKREIEQFENTVSHVGELTYIPSSRFGASLVYVVNSG